MGLAFSVLDTFAKRATDLIDTIPVLGNAAICADCVCTTGRAGINFYCAPNPIAKALFGASCAFGVLGAVSSGTALETSFLGIPVSGCIGAFGARSFNRLGKYTLKMGTMTSGNITSDLMS